MTPVCRKLRTKRVDGIGAPGEMWAEGHDPTAAFHCLKTQECFGPDEQPCHPHRCGSGRDCYQPSAHEALTS